MPYQQRARKESPDDLDKGALTREEETSEEEEEPQGETRGSSHALPKKHTPPNRPVGSGINVGGSSGGSSGSKRPIFVISAIVLFLAVGLGVLGPVTNPVSVSPQQHQNGIGSDDSAARLKRREKLLSTFFASEFQDHGSRNGTDSDAGARETGLLVARGIVKEVLLRRERQLVGGTIKRAVTFHFAGDTRTQENEDAFKKDAVRMARVVGQFVLSDQKGQSVLHIGNKNASDWDHARKLVARHLAKNPHAVVVLHDADKAPAERLYDLEDAFETPYLQDEGVRIACASTVFILVSSLGQQLKTSICDDVCTPSHRTELMRRVKEQSQQQWPRQAFVARIRDIVPFV